MNAPTPARAMLSEAAARAFEREIAKYPPEWKSSAVIACLAILQQEHGYISQESEQLVAEALGMPVIAVHEVTTFYNMFNQVPVGRFKINVCTNLPCQLRGGQHALEHLCSRLGIDEGGTSADGAFTVQKAECLGACADAPVLLVNDRQMLSFMSDGRLDELVVALGKPDSARAACTLASTSPASRRPASRPASPAATSSRRSTPASTAGTGA
jgi:NADH-quinone oxidoreductase subunit E